MACIHVQSVLQKIVPEGEWDAFMEKLRSPLPTTFRINGRGKFAADLRNRLEQDFFSQFQDPIEVNSSHSREAFPDLLPFPSRRRSYTGFRVRFI